LSDGLADGANAAEVLLREGRVLAARAENHPRHAEFAAAQAAAIADQVGIWAPGACASDTPRADLSQYLLSSAFALQRARLAVGVLNDQARSAPLVASTPSWQATTGMALAWAHDAGQALQTVSGDDRPDIADIAPLGRELQAGADIYAAAVRSGDVTQIESAARELFAIATSLSSAFSEVSAMTAAYALGD
jgi:hypothetical protein